MFKVKINMVGFDKYNGLIGVIPFTNGVSDREVTQEEANRLGALMNIVRVDNDEQVGAAINMVKARNLQGQSKAASVTAKAEPKPVEPVAKAIDEPTIKYDRESLEAIAEKGGIKAIRKIGDEFGVKGVQINGLIEEIIQAQSKEV